MEAPAAHPWFPYRAPTSRTGSGPGPGAARGHRSEMIFRMAERAGSGTAAARAWEARLGWAHGLIADDPAERAVALACAAAARRRTEDALDRWHEAERSRLSRGPLARYRRSASLRKYLAVRECALPDGLWDRPRATDLRIWPGLRYALLYLEWEARHPQDWTRYARSWGTKQRLIRDLAAARRDGAVSAKLTDLVEVVVRRPYRCKDREYAGLARTLDSDDLRDRLGRAAGSAEPWARRQAGYVLWLLDHPELPNTPHVWRTWLSAAG